MGQSRWGRGEDQSFKTDLISDTNAYREMVYTHMEWWSHGLRLETRSSNIRRM